MAKKRHRPNAPLIRLREAVNLTQREFAETIGRSWSFVIQAESGRDTVGKETGLLIHERFGKDMDRCGVGLADILRGRFLDDAGEAA